MYTFEDLKEIMERLRSENGCPWDREQTHESLKKYFVEECAEVLEAIDNKDTENLCEELGDVLYQIMIHTEIEKEKGNFTIEDVVDGICRKMVGRHPAVFGGEPVEGNLSREELWEALKRREREEKPGKREKTLTKKAETYINVRVHGNGSAGGSVRRFRSMILGGNRDE